MMINNNGFSLTFLIIMLISCSAEKEPDLDKNYYLNHEAERIAKVDFCKKNAAKKDSHNCKKALSAQMDIDVKILIYGDSK